jgi:hypothetical protein
MDTALRNARAIASKVAFGDKVNPAASPIVYMRTKATPQEIADYYAINEGPRRAVVPNARQQRATDSTFKSTNGVSSITKSLEPTTESLSSSLAEHPNISWEPDRSTSLKFKYKNRDGVDRVDSSITMSKVRNLSNGKKVVSFYTGGLNKDGAGGKFYPEIWKTLQDHGIYHNATSLTTANVTRMPLNMLRYEDKYGKLPPVIGSHGDTPQEHFNTLVKRTRDRFGANPEEASAKLRAEEGIRISASDLRRLYARQAGMRSGMVSNPLLKDTPVDTIVSHMATKDQMVVNHSGKGFKITKLPGNVVTIDSSALTPITDRGGHLYLKLFEAIQRNNQKFAFSGTSIEVKRALAKRMREHMSKEGGKNVFEGGDAQLKELEQ